MNYRKSVTRLLATTALAAVAVQAHAQDRPAEATTLGEIVVTASRVESNAQKTPVALTVYAAEALQQAGVASVQALSTIDPSINVTSSAGAAYVAVRGIASTDITEIGDPSVPVARDGFFTNRSFSIQSSMYDLERVEVLKGPQGTLFGRNATGGLISIVTKKPGKDYGGSGGIEIGNYGTVNVDGVINIPLSDKVQLRASAISRHHDGYRDLTVINQKGDDEDGWSARVQLAFQPFEGFEGLVSYQHDNIDAVGDVAKTGPLGVVVPKGDVERFPNYQPTLTKLDGDRVRWEFSYDRLPGGLTLFYAGGYDKQDFAHRLDATATGGPLSQFVQSEMPRTWNHEVRVTTPQDQPFTVQAGYFHFEETNPVNSGLLLNSGPFATRYLVKFDYNVESKSDAVFAQAGYKLSDALKFTVGARYTKDQKVRTGQARLDLQVASGGFLPPVVVITPGNGDLDQSKPTYHIGLDWTPTPTTLVYAKYDTGYKSGGFNSNGSAPSIDYDPEELEAVEVGTKNRFFDEKLQLNAAAFYQKYSGYQASQTSSVIGGGSGVFNIGDATIKGLEVQAVALVTGIGRFDANATLLDAHFNDDVGSVLDGGGTSRNIDGNRLPNAPRFAASAGFEHTFAFSEQSLTARIDGKYSSNFYYSVFNDRDTEQKAYATGNLSLTYAPAQGSWKVLGYVRNFTDEAVFANAARNFVVNLNTYQFQPPRTYGARVSFEF